MVPSDYIVVIFVDRIQLSQLLHPHHLRERGIRNAAVLQAKVNQVIVNVMETKMRRRTKEKKKRTMNKP